MLHVRTHSHYAMFCAGQDVGQCFAYFQLVVDDEDLAVAGVSLARCHRMGGGRCADVNRQRNCKDGSAHSRTVDPQRAPTRFDDAGADGQSDAGANADGFGCEVRFETGALRCSGMPGPLSATATLSEIFLCIEPARQTYLPVRGLLLQRLLRVDYQVEQDLMQLVAVSEDRRNILRELEHHFVSMLLVRIA